MPYAIVETTDDGAVMGVSTKPTLEEAMQIAVAMAVESCCRQAEVEAALIEHGFHIDGSYRITVLPAR